MQILKQYVIFATNNIEAERQLEKIAQEFDYAGWAVRKTIRGAKYPGGIITKNDVRIHITCCVLNGEKGIKLDRCWISNNIDKEKITDIIMPLVTNDTPEIHFF